MEVSGQPGKHQEATKFEACATGMQIYSKRIAQEHARGNVSSHQCTLLHAKVGQEILVVLVKNLNPNHNQNNPMLMSKYYVVCEHTPVLQAPPPYLM